MKARKTERRRVRSLTGAVRVRVAMWLVRAYCRARLLLRGEMERAPSLAELIEHEFSGRTVAMIVEEYLDRPTTPRLRGEGVVVVSGRRQGED